jgi:hypothetical protein
MKVCVEISVMAFASLTPILIVSPVFSGPGESKYIQNTSLPFD